MKYVAALTLGAALFASPAFADSVPQPTPMPSGTIVYSAPSVTSQGQVIQTMPYATTPQYGASRYSARQESFFGRLMEMERRKNAWLRRTFLGQ